MAYGKPSFFGSVMSGIAGWFKGLLAGGFTGMALGAVAGVAIGAFTGGLGWAALAAGAINGAAIGGSAFAAIGAIAGTMTGVVKSRESASPSANDVVKVAKATFAQGVAVGQQMGQSTSFADRIAAEREAQALSQRVH